MLCHGVMGKRTWDQDHNCKDSLNCPGFSPDFVFETYQQDPKNSQYGALARDGISCTVCHHIDEDKTYGQPAGLNYFLEHSINGQYEVGKADELNGPFKDITTYPMESALGVKPKEYAYLQSSRMCGSCHTINLPVIDAAADSSDRRQQRVFNRAGDLSGVGQQPVSGRVPAGERCRRSCQDCHMPGGYNNKIYNFSVPEIQGRIAVVQDTTYP